MQCKSNWDVGDVDNKILKIYINKKKKSCTHTHARVRFNYNVYISLSLTYGRIFIFIFFPVVSPSDESAIFRLATRIRILPYCFATKCRTLCLCCASVCSSATQRVRRVVVVVTSSGLLSATGIGQHYRKIALRDTTKRNTEFGSNKRDDWTVNNDWTMFVICISHLDGRKTIANKLMVAMTSKYFTTLV